MTFLKRYGIELYAAGFLILFLLFLFGWISNGRYGMHYDLASIWAGVAALSGGGMLSVMRYLIASALNTDKGSEPFVDHTEQIIVSKEANDGKQ